MPAKHLMYLIAVVFTLALTGCHPLFCAWESGYDLVKKQDDVPLLTGEYRLTPHSVKMMRYEGNYQNIPDSRLYIQPNGIYKITNAPDWLITTSAESYGQYVPITGKWSFTCDNKTGCVLELNGLQTGSLLHVKDCKPAILLNIGDPDGCQGMVYEKLE